MQRQMTQRALPTAITIEAEAARIEKMIAAVNHKIESSDCNLRTFMHLQVCRAELQTYFAGLLYALGYTNLLDTQHIEEQLNNSRMEMFGIMKESSLSAEGLANSEACEDGPPRLIQFYEC